MKKIDRISSIVLILIAIVVFFGSLKMGLGRPSAPGPGLIPLFTSVLLILFSLPILIGASRGEESKLASQQVRVNYQKVVKVIIGLFVFIPLLPILGYVMSVFLLMLFFFKGVENFKWRSAVITAVLVVLASYLLFDVWLECRLPVGLFGC